MFNLFSLPQFDHTRVVVWYQTPSTFRTAGGIGLISAQKKVLLEIALGTTHRAICEFFIDDHNAPKILDNVYTWMQSDVWSPNGEARDIIKAAGVSHTSMSIGDIVQIGERFFSCEMVGFEDITQMVSIIEHSSEKLKIESN
jgi:hypothetical protein